MKKEIVISCVILLVAGVIFTINYFYPVNLAPVKSALFTFVDFTDTKKLKQENEKLKKQIIKIRNTEAKCDILEKENKELKILLDINYDKKYIKTYAEVIAQAVAGDVHFTIDKGKNHGISSGDVVVFGSALVGRVGEVFADVSKVIPISAPETSVGATVSRTAALGYTEGNYTDFRKNSLELSLFGANDYAAAGDKILTSGLGTVFPKGLLIGTVTDSTDKKSSTAEIALAVDLFSLRNVCVLSEVAK